MSNASSAGENRKVGHLGVDPRRPERLSLILSDGKIANHFAIGETADDLRPVFAAQGLTLHADNTVTRP